MVKELLTWRLESRSLSAMRDFVIAVGYVHLLYNSSWKCHQLESEQPLPGRMVYGPS
jgi:hypothetical protein